MEYEKLNIEEGLDGSVWYMQKRLSAEIAPHIHRELEFNLIRAGQAEYIIKGKKFLINQGTLLWLFPEQQHVLINASDNFEMYIAVFKPDFLNHLVNRGADANLLSLDLPTGYPKNLAEEPFQLLRKDLDEIIEAKKNRGLFNAMLGMACVKTWQIYQEASSGDAPLKIPKSIETVLHLLEDKHENYTLEALGEKTGCSVSQLSRQFLKYTGVSIVEYRNKKKIDEVVKLVTMKKIKITEAAYAAGFGSYAQFHRTFKDAFGYGPQEFMKRRKALS